MTTLIEAALQYRPPWIRSSSSWYEYSVWVAPMMIRFLPEIERGKA